MQGVGVLFAVQLRQISPNHLTFPQKYDKMTIILFLYRWL